MAIVKGSIYRATYNVFNDLNQLTNPSAATLTIVKPDGTAVSPAPTITLPPAVQGKLLYDYVTTTEGWHAGFWSTTNPTTTKAFSFNVAGQSADAIVSLAQAKRHLNMSSLITTDDEELSDFISVVTNIVELRVGDVVRKTYSERYSSDYCIALRHGPVIEVTSIDPWTPGFGGESVALSDITLDPVTWIIERNSGVGFYYGPYRVAYVAGRSVIPANVQNGALEVLAHIWETQRGETIIGPAPGPGEDDQAFAIAGRAWTVPRSVLETLAPHDVGPRVG
jgi:hypothetical protein